MKKRIVVTQAEKTKFRTKLLFTFIQNRTENRYAFTMCNTYE